MTEKLLSLIQRRAADPASRTDSADVASTTVYPPATPDQIVVAKRRIGFDLPNFLAQVYEKVGNGGFGPGYGLIGLPDGFADDGHSILDLYEMFAQADPEDATWHWPAGLVPVCHWGCNIYSCVDFSTDAAPVITFDANARGPGETMLQALAQTHARLVDWFRDWVSGVRLWDRMFEDDPKRAKTIINPFTKKPETITPKRLRR
jgi:hypothetical protein